MIKKALYFVLAGVFGLAGTLYAGPKEFAELVKAAEKEGMITWQCGLRENEAKPLVEGFQQKYPKIKVVVEKESGSQEKLLREVLGGAELTDIIQFDPDVEMEFVKLGVLEKVNWADFNVAPQLRFYDGMMVGTHLHSHVFVYNTNLLKKEDAPKTWQDLLAPKWAGKFTVDTSFNAFLRLVGVWGQEKVIDYLTKLGKQKPIFVRGHSETMALMSAGQYMLSSDPLLASAKTVADKGGPLAWNAPDVVPAGIVKAGILKKNIKHPNAAKLFLGWEGSEGYKLLDKGNPARSLPFGGTYTAKLFAGKTMSWTPTPEQLPDRPAFFAKASAAVGVPK
jgi:iron(III) transport system substrate-binding protein